jgi:hypothetical protein
MKDAIAEVFSPLKTLMEKQQQQPQSISAEFHIGTIYSSTDAINLGKQMWEEMNRSRVALAGNGA